MWVAYEDTDDDLHVSGHASAGELQLLMQLVAPQLLYPIGGSFRHMRAYANLAAALGWRQEQIILPAAKQVVEFYPDRRYRLAEVLGLKYQYVQTQPGQKKTAV